MDASPLTSSSAIFGIILGLVAHRGLFIKGEWHVRAPEIFLSHLGLFTLLLGGSVFSSNKTLAVIFALGLVAYTTYLISLTMSILLYRIWFHPLSKAGFKGPFFLRTSKIWHVWICRHSTNHLFLDSLHQKYGDFVRTGQFAP